MKKNRPDHKNLNQLSLKKELLMTSPDFATPFVGPAGTLKLIQNLQTSELNWKCRIKNYSAPNGSS